MLLGIDLGTTNVKALVTDFAGRQLGEGSCAVHLFQIGNGGVEQDLEEIWRATVAAVRAAVKSVDALAIKAVGVSSQGGAMQMLDAKDRPVGRTIGWLDQRGAPFDDALFAELGEPWLAQRIGHGRPGLAIGQILRLRKENPALLKAPNRIGFVGDVIVSRLCGEAAHDGTSCSLTLLYNPAKRDYDPELLQRLGVERSQLPALLTAREPAGALIGPVAEQLGLPAGIPVSAAIHDQYTAALSVGAVRPGTVMVGTGTVWVLLAIGDKLTPPATPDAFVCHHAAEDLWGQLLSLENGGSALSWVLSLTGHRSAGGEKIDRLLESVPAGSDGLICCPQFAALSVAGLPPNSRARIVGLQLSHKPEHLVRAVLEGLAYELRRHIEMLRAAGMPITRLALSGRAAASRVTPQLLAAVTGLPLDCAGSRASSQLGAAIVARGLCEPTVPLAKLAEEMAPAASHVAPDPALVAVYQGKFDEFMRSLPAERATT